MQGFQKLESAGLRRLELGRGSMANPTEIRPSPLPYIGYHAEFGRSRSDSTSILRSPPPKKKARPSQKWAPRVPPFKVTQSQRSGTYNFLLLIRSKYGFSHTIYETIGDIC